MRRKKNRYKVETLFILGAGASRALSSVSTRKKEYNRRPTPLDADFLKRLDVFKPERGWPRSSCELIASHWLDESDLLGHGLEEAIIKRAAAFDMLSSLYPEKSRKKCPNEEYLYHLSHLIAYYLRQCRSNRSGNTRRFVNKVFPPNEQVANFRNRIITFNYDMIIDRPLIKRGISKRKLYFDRIVGSQAAGIRRRKADIFKFPLLLKLHGSLNWRCSRDYFENIIKASVDPEERIPIWSNDATDTKCPSPTDDESPLIIPPIPNKPITRASIFKMLWTTSLEYLTEAKRIIIVGYSCPETDVLAQSMASVNFFL